uniref:HECT domain-containing protein n=1 Tax=Myripristis murdjan TaxID=586833 RepID=A0A667ZG40_9TELE
HRYTWTLYIAYIYIYIYRYRYIDIDFFKDLFSKEFENMPKAPCNTCRKLIPLQVLPVHIKSCKEENIDLLFSEINLNYIMFGIVMNKIIIKKKVCPPSANFKLRLCSEDVLNWISCQVDEGSTFPLCVSRSDLFNRGMQQWLRQKKSSPKSRLKVTFLGESGVDTGALGREFLTEMVAGIEKKLFTGSTDNKGKNPLYCLSSLDNNYFRTAGEIMAASMAQGGPLPNFMREWCYRYLCSGDSDSVQVSTSDVTDLELSQLIMEVMLIKFLNSDLTVDAAFILEKCQPDFSEKGSVKYSREVNIMNFLQDFLQETEDCGIELPQHLTVGRIMQWITGQAHKPVLPSERKDFIISVNFYHDCDESHTICFPTVSACSRTITFPIAHVTTFSEFRDMMKTALSHGQSFFRV